MASHHKYIFGKYFSFDRNELIQIIVTCLVIGFSVSFGRWGDGDTVNFLVGIRNFLLGFIFALIAMFAHVSSQKLWAINSGYVVRYAWWKLGLLVSVFLTFVVTGIFPWLPVFFTGTLELKTLTKTRVGMYRPRWKFWDYGLVSFAGPLANLILILLVKAFAIGGPGEILMYFLMVNLFVMIYSLIPIPLFHGVKVIEGGRTAYDLKGGTIGFNMFLMGRSLYLFFLVFVLVYAFLILVTGIFSFFLALLIGIIVFCVFYFSLKSS